MVRRKVRDDLIILLFPVKRSKKVIDRMDVFLDNYGDRWMEWNRMVLIVKNINEEHTSRFMMPHFA